MMSTTRIANLESFLRLAYGEQISVGWCIYRRDHVVIFSNRQPLLTGTIEEILIELL